MKGEKIAKLKELSESLEKDSKKLMQSLTDLGPANNSGDVVININQLAESCRNFLTYTEKQLT